MSGGDGRDHGNRGPTGGVKGGPTGFGLGSSRRSGKNRPNVAIGGSMDFVSNGYHIHVEGVHALDTGEGSNIHWGGGEGRGNNGGNNGGHHSSRRSEDSRKAEREAARQKAEAEQQARLAAEEKARQQAAWDAAHPVEAAQREVEKAEQAKVAATQRVAAREVALRVAQQHPDALTLSDPVAYPIKELPHPYYENYVGDAVINNKEWLDLLLNQGVDAIAVFYRHEGCWHQGCPIGDMIKDVIKGYERVRNRLITARQMLTSKQNELDVAQAELAQASQHVAQAHQAKEQAQSHVNTIRQEKQRQRDEEDARQRAEEAKNNAIAQAKAKARLQEKGLFAVMGFPARAAISASPMTFAFAGAGSTPLTGAAAEGIWASVRAGLTALGRTAVASPVGAIVAAIATGFYPTKVGEGSDNVPGRTAENIFSTIMPSDALNLPSTEVLRKAAREQGIIQLPVRGRIILSNGEWKTELVKTSQPTAVRVVEGIMDESAGFYGYTVPGEADLPGRTILISPGNAPGSGGVGPLVHPAENPITFSNTGGQTQSDAMPRLTTYPGSEEVDFNDLIVVPPLESGDKPIYAMFNSPYGETTAKGKYSGRAFNPEKAGGSIQKLGWKDAHVDQAGIDKVKLHTGRFGASAANEVMIERLDKILKGELQATDIDKRYYTHEIRELERYRALGIKDGAEEKSVWNDAHTATLEDYKVNENREPLYTKEAIEAYEKQEYLIALKGE